jgi:hypothetical protein
MKTSEITKEVKKAVRKHCYDCKQNTYIYVFWQTSDTDFEGGYRDAAMEVKEGFRSDFIYYPYTNKFYSVCGWNRINK